MGLEFADLNLTLRQRELATEILILEAAELRLTGDDGLKHLSQALQSNRFGTRWEAYHIGIDNWFEEVNSWYVNPGLIMVNGKPAQDLGGLHSYALGREDRMGLTSEGSERLAAARQLFHRQG